MRTRWVLSSALSVMLLGASFPQPQAWPAVSVVQHSSVVLGPGVTFDAWRLMTDPGPLSVYVTAVDLRNPLVALTAATHGNAIVGQDEPLSAMADRAHAEAAINADYFDINGSGAPLNALVIGGRVLHQPDGATVFAVGPNNAVTMGPLSLHATLADATGDSLQINAVNDWSTNAGLALLTPDYGASADADLALMLAPNASKAGAYRVTAVRSAGSIPPLPAGQLAVIARGAEQVGRLSTFASLNGPVTVRFDGAPPLGSIASAVGGGPLLLSGGAPALDPSPPAPQEANVRYPVTGAGVSADGATLWLVAVDGRAPSRSIGITRPMLGALLAALGASTGMAFDSGGSTEMAVRFPGDPGVSVANVPSDGKERSIADALLVVNTAPPGPLATVLLDAPATTVLAGSHLPLRAAGVDAHLQPVSVQTDALRFSGDAPAVATVDAQGTLSAIAPGIVHVTAAQDAPRAQGARIASAPLTVRIVASLDALAIDGYARDVAAGAAVKLAAAATMHDGTAVAVDPSAVAWSAQGDGTIGADGTFVGGASAGVATVSASAGRASAQLQILVGEHAVPLDPSMTAVGAPLHWRFASAPATVTGSVDTAGPPDGSRAMHLDYAFGPGATRAAYAQTELPLLGEPLAISIEVYGDGNGEWLRGGYRNADGIDDTVTLARHVDWSGWKTLRVPIPAQARWPIVWTKLYAVETRSDAMESGDLWFRSFAAVYAGPPETSTPP